MNRYIAATVKYLPVTDSRGSRVKITLPRFKVSKTIPFDHQYNNSEDIAIAFLNDNGVSIEGTAELDNGSVLIIDWTVANRFALEQLSKF
jgi:hypothetical protein